MFLKIGVLKRFATFTRKHLPWSLFNKFAGLKACNIINKRLQHRCFPMNIAKMLGKAFPIEHLRWLLVMIYMKFPYFKSSIAFSQCWSK